MDRPRPQPGTFCWSGARQKRRVASPHCSGVRPGAQVALGQGVHGVAEAPHGPEQVEAESRSRIPARRHGRPEEFGAVGAFLCSELAGYVTGVALRCDGGLVTTL